MSQTKQLRRIVRLSFFPEKADAFRQIFRESAPQIRNFPGCLSLELWQEAEADHVFFTYSIWESAEALENYRRSELFQKTWAKAKQLFNDKPMAWSAYKTS